MHSADLWWQCSVIASFEHGWLASTVYRNRNSRRWISLRTFHSRWLSGRIDASLPDITLFCPSEAEAGHVALRSLDHGIFMYLSPALEFDSLRDVQHSVFHELAHLELHHLGLPEASRAQSELQADALAEKWGCPGRKRGRRIFSLLVERPLKSSR